MRTLAALGALLVVTVILAGATQAAPAAQDDGCLVVSAGRGVVTMNARGFVFGRFDQGQVDIDDPLSTDGGFKVFGFQKKRVLSETKTRYIGVGVRYRASGLFRIRVEAVGMGISLAGKGTATLSSDNFFDAGRFSVDAASFCETRFQPMPDIPLKVVITGQGTG